MTATGLDLEDGPLDASAVVWAAGFSVPAIARDAGIAVDDRGRMVVDEWLRSVSHPDIYGAGDAVAAGVRGKESRMSCQTGLPMGVRVADVIARRLTGRKARPVRIRYVWQNISLGRHNGVTQFTRADDSAVRAILTGRTSALSRNSSAASPVSPAATPEHSPATTGCHPQREEPADGRSRTNPASNAASPSALAALSLTNARHRPA